MLDAVAVIWTGCGHMATLIAEVVKQSTVSGVQPSWAAKVHLSNPSLFIA